MSLLFLFGGRDKATYQNMSLLFLFGGRDKATYQNMSLLGGGGGGGLYGGGSKATSQNMSVMNRFKARLVKCFKMDRICKSYLSII